MTRIAALVTKPALRPIVAVIDDGVVLDHPDIAPQLFSAGRTFASVNTVGDSDSASGDNLQTPADQPIFHGTHVAATVAAATFDAVGGAGVAPMAQILPRGALSVDVVQAMLYAAYLDAIARVRAAGVIVVAAAGNGGNVLAVGTPANCAGTITVGATNAQRQPSFGPLQGTSMATPHVADVLALMRYLHPGLTPAQLDSQLAQGALTDDLGATGRDTQYGWGLINVRKAVDAALPSSTPTAVSA